jgi:hypothetical protein
MKKLICLFVFLAFVASASAGYIGSSNAGNGWDASGAIAVVTAQDVDPNVLLTWSDQPSAAVLVNGAGMDTTGQYHANETLDYYPGGEGGWDTFMVLHNYDLVANKGRDMLDADKYDSDMTASGMLWFAFEFDQIYEIGDMEVWNWNDSDKLIWCSKNITVSYTTTDPTLAGTVWDETVTATLTQGTGLGWNDGDAGELAADVIAIDGLAKYVVITIETDYDDVVPSQFRAGLSEVRFEEVPEPATIALLGLGGLTLIRRRKP